MLSPLCPEFTCHLYICFLLMIFLPLLPLLQIRSSSNYATNFVGFVFFFFFLISFFSSPPATPRSRLSVLHETSLSDWVLGRQEFLHFENYWWFPMSPGGISHGNFWLLVLFGKAEIQLDISLLVCRTPASISAMTIPPWLSSYPEIKVFTFHKLVAGSCRSRHSSI